MSNAILVLHAHLPFVRHPDREDVLEERWLFEAISETYLPLLRTFHALQADSVPFRLAMSISPSLVAMLQDPLLMERFAAFLDRSQLLAERELQRTQGDPVFAPLAAMYHERVMADREDLQRYGGNVVKGFEIFARSGHLELLGTAATHAFLPNYRHIPELVRVQIEQGLESHHHTFGSLPEGFWLPECGYYEGLDQLLADSSITYTIGAAHGVLFGTPVPRSGTYAPVVTRSGVHVFPRDVYTANWVWSGEEGYPADVVYRDFYRDIGYDLPLNYVEPFIHQGNIRIDTGFKYYAVTGKTDEKVPYNLELGRRRAREHALDFYFRQREHAGHIAAYAESDPVITSPYDAELFGHWWYEGPMWLEQLFRVAHEYAGEPGALRMTTPSAYLKAHQGCQGVEPAFSSWGSRGYAEVWLDGSNDWIYRHIHRAIERMGELVARFPNETGLKERALNQAAREVLLAMGSDWPFILNARTVVPYATNRIKEHLFNFTRIYDALSRRNVGTDWLTAMEKKNNVFPNLNYRTFRLDTLEGLNTIS